MVLNRGSYSKMPKTNVRKHKRKGKIKVRKHKRKIPKRKGTMWHTDKFIHEPRLNNPEEFIRIRISQEKWPKKKWMKPQHTKKIKQYAKKEKLKLPKDFPKSTRVKIGPTKEGFKAQSLLSPVNFSNFTGLGGLTEKELMIRRKKSRDYQTARMDFIRARSTGNLIDEIAAKEKMRKLEEEFTLT